MATGFSGMMKSFCRSRALVLTAAVIALLLPAGTASATPHATIDLSPDPPLPCENCHTLSINDGNSSTSYLADAAPGLTEMIGMTTYKDTIPPGGDGIADAPDILGCLLCHSQPLRSSVKMRNILPDFDYGKASMHPIGKTLSTAFSLNTNNEYQANWTGNALVGFTGGTGIANELQCVWCHNVSVGGAYPDHDTVTTTNPRMLFNVTAAADLNGHCYTTCHVGNKTFTSGSLTITVSAMGHVGYAAFVRVGTSSTDTMKTARGTPIVTADCKACHNTHSSGKVGMIRDGSEGTPTIDETNCTAVCHGIPTNFTTRGHGQFAGFPTNGSCGPCHNTAVRHRAPGNKKRFFPGYEISGASTITYNGSADTLDNDYDGVINNAAEATWAFPQESMCKQCHFNHSSHGGTIGANTGYASCLDCHDPHGTGVGNGNIMMIRGTIGATAGKTPEPTTYTGTVDFYNGSGTGVCDNANCHGATIATIMALPVHTGVVAGRDCTECHRHTGSASFGATCNTCHGNPDGDNWWPDETAGIYPDRAGAHVAHVDAVAIARYGAAPTVGQKNTTCDTCHPNPGSPRSGTGEPLHNDDVTPADVHLDGRAGATATNFKTMPGNTNSVTTGTLYNNGTVVGTGKACTNLDCHYLQLTPSTGTSPNIGWDKPAPGETVTCSMCHGQGANIPWPNAGSHNPHFTAMGIATLSDAAAPPVCDYCHTGFGSGSVEHRFDSKYDVAIAATFQDKSAGAMSYLPGGTATGTCTNVSCHGGETTGPWGTPIDATVQAGCDSCHAGGTLEYNSYQSGKHTAHVSKYQCTACHAGTPVAGHFLQANLITTAMINPTTYNTTNLITYTDSTTTGPPYFSASGSSGNCAALAAGCHSGGVNWDPTVVGGCRFCHGYPPTSASDAANNKHANGVQAVDHDFILPGSTTIISNNHDECSYCHGAKGTGGTANPVSPMVIMSPAAMEGAGGVADTYNETTHHKSGSIEMNGDNPLTPGNKSATYTAANRWCATTACHGGNTAHSLGTTGATTTSKNLLELGPGLCSTCHNDGGSSAPQVPPTTALRHVNPAGTGPATAPEQCTACHTGHADGTSGVNHVEIPTRYGSTIAVPTMNQQYSSHSYAINLGGTATAAYNSTEAEMCWGCHAAVGVSEWGTNTNTTTGSISYDYGSLSTSNWTTATWSPSAARLVPFGYKVGAIQSTHSVNYDSGKADVIGSQIGKYTEAPDAVADIRCTYCHDVHDTMPVGVSELAADVNGQPYLRGSWRGNPYLEDGAPFSTTTYTSSNQYGAVPRGGTQYTQSGGYYIDQNTPFASTPSGRLWTSILYGGLCEKCHGNNDGSWATPAGELGAIDWKTGENLWVGTNGHANSVRGGPGPGANIFDYTHGRQTPVTATSTAKANIIMTQGLKTPQRYGYRFYSGANYLPAIVSSSAYLSYNWGASVDNTTINPLYHKFSCSKCHNPHASRLPKLLITNCLDINHATWDEAKGSKNMLYSNTYDYTGSKYDAYYSAAQNCHRADDGTVPKTLNPGWNKVSPWGGSW